MYYKQGIITYWNENAGGVAIIPLWYETSPDAMPYRTGSVMMHVMTDTVDAQRLPEIQGYVCNESFTAQRAIVMTFSCMAQDVSIVGIIEHLGRFWDEVSVSWMSATPTNQFEIH
jgi:hypothetical protein